MTVSSASLIPGPADRHRRLATKLLIAALAAAIVLRMGLALAFDWRADFAGGDSGYYLEAARALPGQWRTFRPPGYAVFVKIVGPTLAIPTQIALSIGAAVLLYVALRRRDQLFAALAAAMVALSPLPVPIELRILSETLYAALVLAALALLYRSSSLASGLAAGVALGLAILTRDTLLLLPLFLIPFLPRRQGLACLAAALLVAAPWYAQDRGSSRLGFNLWVGTWERNADWMAPTGPAWPAEAFRSNAERARLSTAFERDDYRPFLGAALERITADPIGVAKNWALRYPRLWVGSRSELNTIKGNRAAWLAVKLTGYGLNLALLVAGLSGMVLAFRDRDRLRLFAAPVIYAALIYIPFHNAETRFSLFAMPFVTVFAVYAVVRAWLTLRSRREQPA
jgi:hypothetical protein